LYWAYQLLRNKLERVTSHEPEDGSELSRSETGSYEGSGGRMGTILRVSVGHWFGSTS
jgi:hypothetical protein